MKSTLCPKCFAITSQAETTYSCTTPGCPKAHAPVLVPEQAPGGLPVCAECNHTLAARICRVCGYETAADSAALGAEMLPVSIIGAEGSGKSNYLSVLIDNIKGDMGKAYNCSLYPLGGDETIELYEKEYYNPLFVQGRCLTSTSQDMVSPLVYSLVFSGEEAAGKTCNITLYDACGQNFDSVKVMNDYNRSIYNSRAILFLVDPSQFPSLREQLKTPGRQVADLDVNALLSRTINLIRNGLALKNMNQLIEIPLAVCLTKIDTVKHLLDPGSFMRYPSRHLRQPRFDSIDFESVNCEVQSIIESWAGKELINQVRSQFETYAFFGFSSLGAPPGKQNRVHRITPHRVIDPFLWALWKNRVITSA